MSDIWKINFNPSEIGKTRYLGELQPEQVHQFYFILGVVVVVIVW
jgi:hypothetical protein